MNASGSVVNTLSFCVAGSFIVIHNGFNKRILSPCGRDLIQQSYFKSNEEADRLTRYKFLFSPLSTAELNNNSSSLFIETTLSLLKLTTLFLINDPSCASHKLTL